MGLSPDFLQEKFDAAGNPVSNDFNDIPTTFDYRTLFYLFTDLVNYQDGNTVLKSR